MRMDKRAATRVVYVDPKNPLHCGIELDEPRNIWGVSVPPDNWDETAVGDRALEMCPCVPRGGTAGLLTRRCDSHRLLALPNIFTTGTVHGIGRLSLG